MHGTFHTQLLCNVEVPGSIPAWVTFTSNYTGLHVLMLIESLNLHTPLFLYAGMHKDLV